MRRSRDFTRSALLESVERWSRRAGWRALMGAVRSRRRVGLKIASVTLPRSRAMAPAGTAASSRRRPWVTGSPAAAAPTAGRRRASSSPFSAAVTRSDRQRRVAQHAVRGQRGEEQPRPERRRCERADDPAADDLRGCIGCRLARDGGQGQGHEREIRAEDADHDGDVGRPGGPEGLSCPPSSRP